jgi:hypothetical protein
LDHRLGFGVDLVRARVGAGERMKLGKEMPE